MTIRFGVFELDLSAAELRKRGRRVKLEAQPFQVLSVLVRRAGELVTREELQREVWPRDTFVEFDHSLNTAVKKIRQALDDSPRNPRYIETAPRQGYRFIGEVETPATEPHPPVAAPRRSFVVPVSLALALLAICIAVWALLRRPATEKVLTAVPLTSYPGSERNASFSPTGNEVAFDWDGGQRNNRDIYVKQLGVDEPFRLTDHPAPDVAPAWSPDGNSIAFARLVSPNKVVYLVKPQRGGPERPVAELEHQGDTGSAWTPDGKWLVVSGRESPDEPHGLFLVAVETQERRRLTVPPSQTAFDFGAAVAPDERRLVFCRYDGSRFDLYLLRLSENLTPEGAPERLTFDNSWNMEPAWTPDGLEILFTSGSDTNSRSIWRMTASKPASAKRLVLEGGVVHSPSLARNGRRLVYSVSKLHRDIWRFDVPSPGEKPRPPAKFLDSTRREGAPSYSADGSKIAFVSRRSGPREIWVSNGDGSDPRQVTSFGDAFTNRPRWSPDGKYIAFYSSAEGNRNIYVIPVAGGRAKRLTSHPSSDGEAEWSSDGKWVYFESHRDGERAIWKVSLEGGEPVALNIKGEVAQESSDGRFLYVSRGYANDRGVWRVPLDGGAEARVLDAIYKDSEFILQGDRIYFVTPPDQDGVSFICYKDLKTDTINKILPVKHFWWYLAVSPGARTLLYSKVDDAGSDLMLVENFR